MNWPAALSPLFSLCIHASQRGDEVKLSGALAKIAEDDPSIRYGLDTDTGELIIWGQGEIHQLIAIEKLKNRYNLQVDHDTPQTSYKETIRK